MRRTGGPYVADPGDDRGQYGSSFGDKTRQPADEILDFNEPPPGQPGLWCQWEPSDDGTLILWDMGEKFYYAPEWMLYLIDHFLRPGAHAASQVANPPDERLKHFTFDHVLNGEIYAQGEEPDDRWILVVNDNKVFVREARAIQFGEAIPIRPT